MEPTAMKKGKNAKNVIPILRVNEHVCLEEPIAQRAHELWQHREQRQGSDMADWFQAEREINEWHQKRRAAYTPPKRLK
jgi:hypothetical protein